MAKRTTVSVRPETRDALNEFKFESRSRSIDEAVRQLLAEAETKMDVPLEA